jgi:hypothetical protein
MPKIKSVELKKIYHFALGSNFKIVRALKLFLKPTNHSVSKKIQNKFYLFTEALKYLHFLRWLKSENSCLQINPSLIFEITSHLYTNYKKNPNFSNITKIPFNVYLSF